MATRPHNPAIALEIPAALITSWWVHEVRGRERISRLPKLKIEVSLSLAEWQQGGGGVAAGAADPLAGRLLGSAAQLRWSVDGALARTFYAQVTAVRFRGRSEDQRALYRLTLRPRLHALTLRRASRCFRAMTALEIAQQLLDEHGVRYRLRVTRTLPKRELSVQHSETDYAVVRRLLAEEGLFFYFDHPLQAANGLDSSATGVGDSEIMVISDTADWYPPIPGNAQLQLRRGQLGSGLQADDAQVDRFDVHTQLAPEAARVRQHDFRHPLRRIESAAAVDVRHLPAVAKGAGAATLRAELNEARQQRRVVDLHHDEYEEHDHDPDEARLALERLRRDVLRADGHSLCCRLVPGHRFQLAGDGETQAAEWVVATLEHKTLDGEDDGAIQAYSFECVPAAVAFRPPLPKRRLVNTCETATVVGAGPAEIHTDAYGRIKIQFHWDRRDGYDEQASCWVRVSQAWAGSGWGSQHIPRVGMEVTVSFVGGDPDRPLVTGCVYNGTQLPPFSLPENATRSGFRSRSSPGGAGFNEFSFDDRAGGEQVFLHAQRELREEIGEDAHLDVGRNRQAVVHKDESINVGGDRQVQISGHSRTVVERDSSQHVTGNLGIRVDESLSEQVGGLAMRHSREAMQTTEHDASLHVGRHYNLVVGSGEQGGALDLSVRGSGTMMADGSLSFFADERIDLVCGGSRLTLSEDGIRLNGVKLALAGEEAVNVKTENTEVNFGGGIALMADTVKIASSGASLILDANASLDGALVKLNCGADGPTGSGDVSEDDPRKPLKLKLLDERQEPYVNCRYEVVSGGRRFSGTTDGDGNLEEQVPALAEQAALDLWPGEVGGERLSWQITFDDIEPASTVKGAQTRLQNLGYYDGAIDGKTGPGTEKALRRFQEDNELEPTGELDEATQAQLMERHP